MTDPSTQDQLQHAIELERAGRFEDAERAFAPLIAQAPVLPMVHFTYACHRLLMGEYGDTWGHFQLRLASAFYQSKGTFQLGKPLWDGFDISDQRVFLHVDQGIGDAVMCARFLPWVADRAGSVVIAVHRRAGPLFRLFDPRIEVVELGDAVPEFDCHIDFFSLPALYRAAPDNMPPAPYLAVDDALRREWRARLAADAPDDAPKVGLVWQGNPDHPRDTVRSIPLTQLRPALELTGMRFFSLQFGPGHEQLADIPKDIRPVDLAPDLLNTAAALAEMDVLISIDSALAHIAAAMDRPVWIVTHRVPDWRWGRCVDRANVTFAPSHWYNAHRLFLAETDGEWGPVVERLARSLMALRDGDTASVEADV